MLAGLALPAGAAERITYSSYDEDITEDGKPTTIDARLYRPEGDGPFPAVIGLHGCGGRDFAQRDAPFTNIGEWAGRLAALGYVVLLPDSFRPRGIDEVCTKKPQPVTPTRQRVRDTLGAAAWLRGQRFVRGDQLFLIGWSHGGSTVLAAVRSNTLRGLRARAGGTFRAAVAFYPGCAFQLKSGWQTATPLLILSGEADDWTPAEPCRQLSARAKTAGRPVDYVSYPGAHHGFDAPNSRIREREGIPSSQRGGRVTVGRDPAARADVLIRVPEYLADHRDK